ncbi:hypothetical protein EHV15_34710 [Paenibacillus oralis]|uniref:Uncharacterized protein n=1 Tax=Paenibacillus oralis TaxID=2490856 RepID=A0A3P3TCD1_9BACL|nr:hypothetical protein [Paenibacillus oralis]RRJ54748.1 hypothetical protein EHV15_34710 [Paenibacillus oralis]
MLKRIGSYFFSLFPKKNKSGEVIVERDIECEVSKNLSETEQTEPLMDDSLRNDYGDDEYDPYEEKYQPMFDVFSDLVKGTRYERFAGRTTSLWAFESLLSDSSAGKTRISARFRLEPEIRFEIDAYHISSSDFEVLKRVLEIADVEANDPEEFEYARFEFEIIQNADDVAFQECYHPHYSSYNTVKGNMYDDNIDTYGTCLRIMAVRSYLLYNTDTNEFILTDGRYWCL